MPLVFWWTGRGFLSLLSLVGMFGAFGAVVTLVFGEEVFDAWPWLWGVGVILAAAVNWLLGSKLNHKPINPLAGGIKGRFAYRARNRFLSLPMEHWSAPLLLFGLILCVIGIAGL